MTYFQAIHEKALRAARTYKKSQHDLLVAIQQVDNKGVHLKYGYKNLYEYCIKCLLLSEGTTYALIRVARKSVEIPEIQKAIAQGTLTLSHAKTILPVIRKENQSIWIEKAKSLSVRNLEKEVAINNPDVSIREKIRPISENRMKIECGINQTVAEIIERAKAILSQKTGTPVNLESAIETVFSEYVDRHDPLKKQSRLATWPKDPTRLTAAMKRERLREDAGRCQAKDPHGNLCGQEQWLDIHHIRPVSEGGSHEFGNLITLCKDHHRLQHRQTYETITDSR